MRKSGTIKRHGFVDRCMRSMVTRLLVVMAVMPVLIIGALGGKTLLAHAHDEHGSHVHGSHLEADHFLAVHHATAHSDSAAPHDHPATPTQDCNDDLVVDVENLGGVSITVPDHDQLSSRGNELGSILSSMQTVQHVVMVCWAPPDLGEELGSPGGGYFGPPPHLASLSASERLVRTNSALLL